MIDQGLVDELAGFSTPSILNGLKRLGLHPREFETTSRHAVTCMTPSLGARAGFAVTRRVSTRRGDGTPTPPSSGAGTPAPDGPKFLVVENIGEWEGPVCIWGEVAAAMNLAQGFVAGITNGPVRDLPEITASGFLTFAGGVDVGGGFVDNVDAGTPVSIGGVEFRSGDLLHGDVHGVVKIPVALAPDLPDAIRAHEEVERRVVEVCRSPEFTPERLAAAWVEH